MKKAIIVTWTQLESLVFVVDLVSLLDGIRL